jgi:hypothetical protein
MGKQERVQWWHSREGFESSVPFYISRCWSQTTVGFRGPSDMDIVLETGVHLRSLDVLFPASIHS